MSFPPPPRNHVSYYVLEPHNKSFSCLLQTNRKAGKNEVHNSTIFSFACSVSRIIKAQQILFYQGKCCHSRLLPREMFCWVSMCVARYSVRISTVLTAVVKDDVPKSVRCGCWWYPNPVHVDSAVEPTELNRTLVPSKGTLNCRFHQPQPWGFLMFVFFKMTDLL